MNGKAWHAEVDPMFSRLKRLPPRLRIAHLAALIRCGKVMIREGSLFYPSAAARGEGSTASSGKQGGRAG